MSLPRRSPAAAVAVPLAAGLAALRRAVAQPLPTPVRVGCRRPLPRPLLPVLAAAGAVRGEPPEPLAGTVGAVGPLGALGGVDAVGSGGTGIRTTAPDPGTDPDRGTGTGADAGDAAGDVLGLVARAQAGDPEAFGCLYDRYVDLVYRYIYYRVGAQALAEDLTSETFLRALRRITSFTWQGRDIGAWFVTIARNLVADHYKSGRFRLEVQVGDMLDADRAQDGPEGEVLDALTNRTLLEAVKRLNPEQQECIVLRFLQGLSVSETALAMGKNEGAIKALQYRAVRTLGRLLPEGFLP